MLNEFKSNNEPTKSISSIFSPIAVHTKSSDFLIFSSILVSWNKDEESECKSFDHEDAHISEMARHFVLIIKWLKNWTDCVCWMPAKRGEGGGKHV